MSDNIEVTSEQAEKFLEWVEVIHALKSKTNKELAGLLVDHVWAYMPTGTPQSELLNEVIDRLTNGEDL